MGFGGGAVGSTDGFWLESVGLCDAMLRGLYGIREFTDDPSCVLRVGLGKVRSPLELSDGTRLLGGETVGTLHFWNEHLPRYKSDGPSLEWACAMRDQLVRSFRALAGYVESDNSWRGVRAFRGETALPARLGPLQILRVFHRYGFEQVASDRSLRQRVHDVGNDCLVWGLTRAFNPAAVPRAPFLRDHCELWISRKSLLRHYLRRQQGGAVRASPSGRE